MMEILDKIEIKIVRVYHGGNNKHLNMYRLDLYDDKNGYLFHKRYEEKLMGNCWKKYKKNRL